MNDLYWSPGGNPDLANEYAIMPEIGIELNEITLRHQRLPSTWMLHFTGIPSAT
jgi:hypothetical protein